MFTRKRFRPPNPTGGSGDVAALGKALVDYLQSLEAKGSLAIGEAEITASQGIKFPATQVASTDVNTLDDYKEVPSTSATILCQLGAFTSASATYSYTKVGNRVLMDVVAVITTNGTAAGVIDVNIPLLPAAQTAAACVRQDGVALTGWVFNNGGQGQARFFSTYDGATYAGGSGKTLYAQVVFRV